MEANTATKQNILDRAEQYVKQIFDAKIPVERYAYHSFFHTLQVKDAAEQIAKLVGCTHEEKEILGLASLFHDVGFVEAYEGHEVVSCRIAREFLEEEGYPEEQIAKVIGCIEATQMGYVPDTMLKSVMKDADLCSLGRKSYFEQAEKLRIELIEIKKESLTEDQWVAINLDFLTNHKFYTEAAKSLFGKRKEKNISKLLKQLGQQEEKPRKMITIGSSKSAQTQFKTALRNHIDLSAIADNKANIMLSVNALIITIALPALGTMIQASPEMLIPTIILLSVCIISIVFATLATRPIKMKGRTKPGDIEGLKSNLFFFGNFYTMTFEQYEKGIGTVVGNDEILDNSITRDLFYLGKALGNKYRYLRHCYNIFMYGIIITVLAFVIVFAITSPL